MKKVIVYCFAFLLLATVGCQKEALNSEETEIAKETEILQKTFTNPNNELVIQYPVGTTEAQKY